MTKRSGQIALAAASRSRSWHMPGRDALSASLAVGVEDAELILDEDGDG